jgi:hypothetical protein
MRSVFISLASVAIFAANAFAQFAINTPYISLSQPVAPDIPDDPFQAGCG